MNNIKLTKHSNTHKHTLSDYTSNDDIEDVLSNGKDIRKFKVNKVNKSDRASNLENNLRDKIELSSNKDVDIGLDLLANAEKKNKNVGSENNSNNDANNSGDEIQINVTEEEVDFDKILSQGEVSDVDELMNELNVDRTSRLSQNEIDAIIDKNKERPRLVNDEEVNDIIEREEEKQHEQSEGYNNYENSSQVNEERHEEQNQYGQNQYNQSQYGQSQYNPHPYGHYQQPMIDPVQERKDKEEILWQLEKYKRLGVQGIRKFNMSSSLDEMREEYNKIKKQRELESSVKFQRKCLMAFVTGAELLNNKLDFLDFKLDGWSEQVNEGIDEYNEVFEELHEKYKEKAKMAPEVKLLFMLGGSAFMYHITNSMFKNSVPGMEDIMKQNPELMKQFANAAINQMDPNKQSAANFFSGFAPSMNQAPPPQSFNRPMPMPPSSSHMAPPPMSARRPMPMSSQSQPEYSEVPEPLASNQSVGNLDTQTMKSGSFNTGTRKIPAPVGVDDILNELQSNTDDVSEIVSRSKRDDKNVTLKKSRPRKSINLNI